MILSYREAFWSYWLLTAWRHPDVSWATALLGSAVLAVVVWALVNGIAFGVGHVWRTRS